MNNSSLVSDVSKKFNNVLQVLESNDYDAAKLIPILQGVQEEYRYLPEEIMSYVAASLDISPARVFGVATFFSHFSLEPKGKFIIKVCDGTACHVKGSGGLISTIRRELAISDKQKTTADMLFTLETVSCLGACGLAPVVVVNEKVFGAVDNNRMAEIIADYRQYDQEAADG